MEYLQSHVIHLQNVVINSSKAVGVRRGGEDITHVRYQKENMEYFTFTDRFVTTACSGKSRLKKMFKLAYKQNRIAPNSMYTIITAIAELEGGTTMYEGSLEGLTVGIIRSDYANMYWTVIELYSAYLTAREMNRAAAETTILILDAHPATGLDGLWELFFKKVVRVGWLKTTTFLEQFALVPHLKLVPIVRGEKPVPYIDDFRYDVSYRAGGFQGRRIDCDRIKITLVLRRNYIAHSRNFGGIIGRQFNNSDDLTRSLKSTFPKDLVRAVALETLTVSEQIRLATETDILIGVHGAGLTLTLFQVPGTGLIELFTFDYRLYRNNHMEKLAVLGGRFYSSWYSDIMFANSVYVPPGVLTDMVVNTRGRICNCTEGHHKIN
ncbi:EGF domain-specific O-linked N-acetylglucosamine transferase-like [Haliotis rubra]|uniref:EGF domain-specific O-linked N-acetylglucosamine transferase-like n=1 Tax=Haliotis rubra TaxID=36100 RepID=UPI001EE55792|nr:EGF domain-specific O-linked N-acetylglucosamine transferase-like [Haliotis rubra]